MNLGQLLNLIGSIIWSSGVPPNKLYTPTKVLGIVLRRAILTNYVFCLSLSHESYVNDS